MRKFLYVLLASSSILTANAETTHCEPSYQGKAFFRAVIFGSVNTKEGPAECHYKNPKDKDVLRFIYPPEIAYYPAGGFWRSAMPGDEWCSIEDASNRYDTCTFY